MSSHDRRTFLRELARQALRAGAELEAALQPPPEAIREGGYLDAPADASDLVPAPPTVRTATADELTALCEELGRPTWAEPARRAAVQSIRLTPGSGPSRLGGGLELPAGVAAPVVEGGSLPCLLQVALEDLPRSPLPRRGTLLVFARLDDPEPPVRVIVATDAPAADAGLPLDLSAELTLPSEPVEPHIAAGGLDDWLLLRERLAAAQGVELEELAADRHALHRLLGHADTVGVRLELEVELLARGLDPADAAFAADSPDTELARSAAEWRLLVQLSADPAAGLGADEDARLYVWIREPDLVAGRFDAARALVR